MEHKNITNRYLKKFEILLTLIVFMLLSTPLGAQETGNITVYIKDQNGDNVIDNSHLGGNLTVELWYEGNKVKTRIFEAGNESLLFTVNHTGLYTVTATAYIKVTKVQCQIWQNSVSDGCCASAWCRNECPDGTTHSYNDSNNWTYQCRSLDCTQQLCTSLAYEKYYTFPTIGIAQTYVGGGESDTVRIPVLTDERRLWNIAITTKNATIVNGGVDTQQYVEYTANKIVKAAIFEVADQVIEGTITGGSKLYNAISTVTISTAESSTDLDEWKTTSGTLKYLADTGLGLVFVYAETSLKTQAEVFILKEVGSAVILPDSKRCAKTETDDLSLFVSNGYQAICQPTTCYDPVSHQIIGTFCDSYDMAIVNHADIINDAKIDDQPYESRCSYIDSNPKIKDISTNEIAQISASWIRGNDIQLLNFTDNAVLYYSVFDIKGGIKCQHNPFLTKFTEYKTYIVNPSYPYYVYPSTTAEIKTEVVDNTIVPAVQINWSYGSLNGTIPMSRTGSGMHTYWASQLPVPAFQQGQESLQFLIQANDTDGISSVNDNDQRNYKIQVVQDANSGKEAPDSQQNALNITGFASGINLTSYLLPDRNDSEDWYKFQINLGQPFSVGFNTSGYAELFVYKDAIHKGFLDGKNYKGLTDVGSEDGYAFIRVKSRTSEIEKYSFYVKTYGYEILTDSVKESIFNIFKPLIIGTFLCGNSEYPGETCGQLQTGAIAQAAYGNFSAEITAIGNNSVYGLHPGNAFIISPMVLSDCNGDNKTYILVNVSFHGNSSLPAYNINPIVREPGRENKTFYCDSVNIGRALNDRETITAKMPLIKNTDGRYIASYAVNMIVYGAFGSIKTQEVRFNISLLGIPEIKNISVKQKFNGAEIKVIATDDNFDKVKIYRDTLLVSNNFNGTYTYFWNTSTLANGSSYKIYARVTDYDNNWAESERVNVTVRNDAIPPNISSALILPVTRGVYDNNVSGNVLISVSAFDSESGINIVRWYRDGTLIGSNSSSVIINTTTLADGIHQIRVETIDDIGNLAYRNFSINVDNTPPGISTVYRGTDPIRDSAILNVTASDSGSGIGSVEWFVNDSGWRKIGSYKSTLWGTTGLNGTYSLRVKVTDRVGNSINISGTVNILNSADLWPYLTEISNANEGETVTVNASIFNTGYRNADNFRVDFMVDNEVKDTRTLSLQPMQNLTLQFSWIAIAGNHEVKVIVDPDNVIQEGYDGDNIENFWINVYAASECNPPLTGNWTVNQYALCLYREIQMQTGSSLFVYNTLSLDNTNITTKEIVFNGSGEIALNNSVIYLSP